MKKKNQSKFKGWERDSVDAEVVENTKDKLVIFFYGYVGIKKNGRTNMRGLSLPSPNYIERHKRMMKCLGNIDYKFNSFPCKLHICILYGNKRRSDLDNRLSSIMDLYQDLGIIEDDNHDVIPEISMESMGYKKNCPIMKVELSSTQHKTIDDNKDCKDTDLKEYKILFNKK